MTVTPERPARHATSARPDGCLPRGWAGTWQIHEKIRKIYVIF